MQSIIDINEEFKTQNENNDAFKTGFGIREDDSFPYQQSRDHYWSGFYSNRPHLKQILRKTSALFHSSLLQSSILVIN